MRIIEDLKAVSKKSKIKLISTILWNPNFHAIAIYRTAHFFGQYTLLEPISKILMYINTLVLH